jgi:hypothetical protein
MLSCFALMANQPGIKDVGRLMQLCPRQRPSFQVNNAVFKALCFYCYTIRPHGSLGCKPSAPRACINAMIAPTLWPPSPPAPRSRPEGYCYKIVARHYDFLAKNLSSCLARRDKSSTKSL